MLIAALIFAGPGAALTVLVLAMLEVSVSFDNAIVNAGILRKMSRFWQQLFLTVGIFFAVFVVRLIVPVLIVAVSAGLDPLTVAQKALAGGSPEHVGTYGYLLEQAHPAIAAFGGTFLLILAINYFFTDRDVKWIAWLERPLIKLGRLKFLSVIITLAVLVCVALLEAHNHVGVLIGGGVGLLLYLVVSGLGKWFEGVADATSRAGLFLFLYLEVLDASFSLDGVIGAFAISSDVLIIASGLGIGAVFIRSLTVMMVHHGTLQKFRYLEHGAHWAIAALSAVMLVSINHEVPGIVTGLVSAAFITAAFIHSVLANRHESSVGHVTR